MLKDYSQSQNFLINKSLIQRLIDASDITSGDLVLDIGAGKGGLTTELARKAKEVVAVEPDPALLGVLTKNVAPFKNVCIQDTDFLKMELPAGNYKVFSNIPFNITSEIMYKLFFSINPPVEAHLVLQKQAAVRFLGRGEGKLVNLLLSPFYTMRIVHVFSLDDFSPRPNVNVVMLAVKKRNVLLVKLGDKPLFYDFISYILCQQKSTLRLCTTSLFTSEQFKRLATDIGFDSNISTGEMCVEHCIRLFNFFKSSVTAIKQELVVSSFNKYMLKRVQPKTHRTRAFSRSRYGSLKKDKQ